MQAEPDPPTRPSPTCAQVLQPGYRLAGGRVLRPARVVGRRAGAAGPSPSAAEPTGRVPESPRGRGDAVSARDYVEKDYYAALGVPKDASAARHQEGLPQARPRPAPGQEPRRQGRGGPVQGGLRGLRRAVRRHEAPGVRRGAQRCSAPVASGAASPAVAGAGPGGFAFDLGDLFGGPAAGGGLGDVFGGLFGGRRRRTRPAPRVGNDVEADVTLAFADAVRGATVPLRLHDDPARASTCSGSGAAPGTAPTSCGVCDGAGVTSRNQGGFAFAEPCRACRGTGRVVETPCPTCRGSGSSTKRAHADRAHPAGRERRTEDPARRTGRRRRPRCGRPATCWCGCTSHRTGCSAARATTSP